VAFPAEFLSSATSTLAGLAPVACTYTLWILLESHPILWKCGVESIHEGCDLQACSEADGQSIFSIILLFPFRGMYIICSSSTFLVWTVFFTSRGLSLFPRPQNSGRELNMSEYAERGRTCFSVAVFLLLFFLYFFICARLNGVCALCGRIYGFRRSAAFSPRWPL
jgi:hypothetical protein